MKSNTRILKGELFEMAFTPEQIEYLHSTGQMPDWVYYQQNGKSAQENWNEQHRKIMENYRQREAEQRRQAEEKALEKKLEADLEKQIEKKLEKALEKALDDLLKDFK